MTELPNGWAKAPMSALIELATGKLDANAATEDGRYPFFTCGKEVLRIDHFSFDQEAVLLAGNGDFGIKHYVGKFNAYQRTYVLRPIIIPSRFLYFLVANHLPTITGNERGSTVRYIRKGDIEDTVIGVPPLPEQRRIAAKIDSLTGKSKRACDHLDHIPRLIEKYKQAVLAAAFRGDLTREWRAKQGINDDWRRVRLEQLIDEGPTNGWSPKSGPDATGALTLKLTATTAGYLRLDKAAVKRIYDTPPRSSTYWLRSGDLLVQRANSLEYVGSAAIYDGPHETFIYPDLMMRVRISVPATRRYVWRYLNSQAGRQYLQERATGTAGNMPKISGGTLRSLPVPLPVSVDERNEVVSRVETAFDWIDRLAADASSARKLIDHLDQAVLAKAFRGELVPQDPADEPASVLLERIKAERAAAAPGRRRRASAG